MRTVHPSFFFLGLRPKPRQRGWPLCNPIKLRGGAGYSLLYSMKNVTVERSIKGDCKGVGPFAGVWGGAPRFKEKPEISVLVQQFSIFSF